MVRLEDECVGCPPELGCLGQLCPYQNVPRCYCDECGEEITDEDDRVTDGFFFYF